MFNDNNINDTKSISQNQGKIINNLNKEDNNMDPNVNVNDVDEQDSAKIKNTFKNSFFIASEDIKEHVFYLRDFIPIPEDFVTLIYGAGGAGKSLLSMQLCIKYILETHKFAFYWNAELTRGIMFKRFLKILKLLHLTEEEKNTIIDKLIIHTEPVKLFKQVLNLLQESKIKFIIFDPLIAFFSGTGGSENDNAQAREFMNIFSDYAKKNHASIIMIHHQRKVQTQENNKYSSNNDNTPRGASAIVDAVGVCYLLEAFKSNLDTKKIKLIKDNLGIAEFFENKTITVLPEPAGVDLY
jgi:predicted ATP-dependent serine protease